MMAIIMSYLYPILFSLIFGHYNGWQWWDDLDGVEDRYKAKGKWKRASVILRSVAYLGAALMCHFRWFDLYHFLAGIAISLPLFDIAINITRGMPLFYLGTTSKTDTLGKWKWITYAILIITTLIVAIA